jgi:hypothetical protein
MKKLILLLPFFLSFSAHAEVRLILSRAKSAPMAAAKMDELAKRPEVLRHSSVFSKVEAERLKKMGAAHLADSRLIFVKDKEAERALLKAVRVADAGLRLEPGELEMWIASEPLESEQ